MTAVVNNYWSWNSRKTLSVPLKMKIWNIRGLFSRTCLEDYLNDLKSSDNVFWKTFSEIFNAKSTLSWYVLNAQEGVQDRYKKSAHCVQFSWSLILVG